MTTEQKTSAYYPIEQDVEFARSRGVVYRFDPREKLRGVPTPDGVAFFVDDWLRIRERVEEASLREQRRKRNKESNILVDLQEL